MVFKKASYIHNLGEKHMKNKRKTVIIIVVLIIPVILILSSYINFRIQKIDNKYSPDFKDELKAAIKNKQSFYMKDLTPFEWDKMYIIPPYTSRKSMQETVGIKWTTTQTYAGYLFEKTWFGEYPLDDDRFYKLVFVKGNKVILDITLDRAAIDIELGIKGPLMPNEALFTIDKSDRHRCILRM